MGMIRLIVSATMQSASSNGARVWAGHAPAGAQSPGDRPTLPAFLLAGSREFQPAAGQTWKEPRSPGLLLLRRQAARV